MVGNDGGGHSGHSRRPKGAALTRRWVVLDSAGNTQALEAGKNVIMRRTSLPACDLRTLDPMLGYPASLRSRERAVVVNVEHVKAIITAHDLLLLNPKDPSVAPFVEELRLKILRHHRSVIHQSVAAPASGHNADLEQPQSLDKDEGNQAMISRDQNASEGCRNDPFEFVALDACLESACSRLHNEARILEREAYPALNKLTSHICSNNIEHVQQIKARLILLTKRVQKVRDELECLLNNDERMAAMYLTDKHQERHNEICSISSIDELVERDDEVYRSNIDADLLEEYNMQEHLFLACKEVGKLSDGHQSSTIQIARNKRDLASLEMIVEAFFIQMDGTLNKLSILKENIEDAHDYVNIMQDGKRNQLLRMVVLLITADMVLTLYEIVVNFYGGNITIGLTNAPLSVGTQKFILMNGVCTGGTILVYLMLVSWYKYKKWM